MKKMIRTAYSDGRKTHEYPDNTATAFWHDFQPPVMLPDRPEVMEVRCAMLGMFQNWPNVTMDSWIRTEAVPAANVNLQRKVIKHTAGLPVPAEAVPASSVSAEVEPPSEVAESGAVDQMVEGEEQQESSAEPAEDEQEGAGLNSAMISGSPEEADIASHSFRSFATSMHDLAENASGRETPFQTPPPAKRTRLQEGLIPRVNYRANYKALTKDLATVHVARGFYALEDLIKLIVKSKALGKVQIMTKGIATEVSFATVVIGESVYTPTQRLVMRVPRKTIVHIQSGIGRVLGFYTPQQAEYRIANLTDQAQEYIAPSMPCEDPWDELLVTSSLVAPAGGIQVGEQTQVLALALALKRNAPVTTVYTPWLEMHETRIIERAHFTICNRFGEMVPVDAMCAFRPLIVLEFRPKIIVVI